MRMTDAESDAIAMGFVLAMMLLVATPVRTADAGKPPPMSKAEESTET